MIILPETLASAGGSGSGGGDWRCEEGGLGLGLGGLVVGVRGLGC